MERYICTQTTFNAQNKVLMVTIHKRHVAEIVVCPLFVQRDLM